MRIKPTGKSKQSHKYFYNSDLRTKRHGQALLARRLPILHPIFVRTATPSNQANFMHFDPLAQLDRERQMTMDYEPATDPFPQGPSGYCADDEYEPGRRVRVIRGALSGLEGIVRERCDDYRLLVKLDAQQSGVLLKIEDDEVRFTD